MEHGGRYLPVVHKDRLIGPISFGDVVENRLEELESAAGFLREPTASQDRPSLVLLLLHLTGGDTGRGGRGHFLDLPGRHVELAVAPRQRGGSRG